MKKILLIGQNNTTEESRTNTNTLDAGLVAQSMDRTGMTTSEREHVVVYTHQTLQVTIGELRQWVENILPDHLVLVVTDPAQTAALQALKTLAGESIHGAPAHFTVDQIQLHNLQLAQAKIELRRQNVALINRPSSAIPKRA